MLLSRRSFAVLVAVLATGLAAFFAVNNSQNDPIERQPSEIKPLSTDTFAEMLADLRQGKEVRVDARAPGDVTSPTKAADASQEINHLRGYGPLPSYAKTRLLSIYQEAIDDLKVRTQTPQGGGQLQDILGEASNLALLEEFLAKQCVVQDGGAFFAEYKLIPSWDGWRVLAEQNQTLIVDGEGIPIDNPATYQGPREAVASRKMAVIVPIELAKFPGLAGALRYRRDMEIEVTKERVDRFNLLSFEDRQAKLQQHISARKAISSLGGSGSGRHVEIANLKKLLLDVPYVDSVSLLARMVK